MDVSASKASLGRWVETVNQPNRLALKGCNMLKSAHELATSHVANLATPKRLHPLHGEVFKEQMIVLVGQFVSQLKKPVTALVDDGLGQTCHVRFGFLPVIGELDLARHGALGGFQFSQGLPIVQRAFNLIAVRCGQEDLQPKVKACAVTRHGLMVWLNIFFDHEVQIEIAQTVTLDGDSLDAFWYISAFAEFIDLALNADRALRAPAAQQLPSGLLEREATILLHLLKAGWGSADFSLEVAKEQGIGSINAVNNVLNGLTAYHVPVDILIEFLDLRDVLHQDKLVQALASQSIISAVQGNAVVVDQPCNVDLLVQKLILFLAIELELVGLNDFHRDILTCIV